MSANQKSPPSIADAEWLRWPGTVRVFAAIGAGGDEVRAVGGAVRDTLLSRPVTDVDFATTALPERIMDLAQDAGLKAVPTGISHGTVTIVADGHGFEITTLRKDVETYGRRAKVAYTDNWAEDASRRDFTINALYAGADGTLFDPLGGLSDISARHVCFIGDARTRVREDYLRILRLFRFCAELATDDFDPDGLAACVRERGGLSKLSGERVRSELLRLLRAPGAIVSLLKMFDYGLLVAVLGGVPYLQRLERLCLIELELGRDADPVLRLAALAVMVPEDAERLSTRLKLSNVDRARLAGAADFRTIRSDLHDTDIRWNLYRNGRESMTDAAMVSWASSGALPEDGPWRSVIERIETLPVPDFPLGGSDLVGLGVDEGPGVGDLLNALEVHWMSGDFTAGKDDLLEVARKLVGETRGNS